MSTARSLALRLGLLAVLVAVASILTFRTLPRIQRYNEVEEVCAAVNRGDWQAALEGSADLVASDAAGRRAAQCRCRALLETGAPEACGALMENLLSSPDAGDWLPDPTLTAVAVRGREARGDVVGATELARRGAREYPANAVLAQMELELRSRTGDETSVLGEFERRLSQLAATRGPALPEVRLDLADRLAQRGEWDQALSVIGNDPDRFPGDLQDPYFQKYTWILAGLGRADDLAAAFREWERRGGDPTTLLARQAVLRSAYQISDRQDTTVKMLREAIARREELKDDPILAYAYTRLIGHLVVRGDHEEALEVYQQAVDFLGPDALSIDRDEILRSATQDILGVPTLATLSGKIRFHVEALRDGDRLLVAPGVDEPADTPYRSLVVPASGRVEVTHGIGTSPVRWVLRDQQDRTVGSGAIWVQPDRLAEVTVERHAEDPNASSSAPESSPAPRAGVARGKRRIFQVILDCGDWHIIQYGIARGDLEFFRMATRRGLRGVLESDPPITAIAISKLVYPEKRGTRSVAELLHQLGREVESLNFIGRNPFAALEVILPDDVQLFETLAQHGVASVNLLHSHGSMQVGRNAEIIGPGDQVRPLAQYRSSRPLDDAESGLLTPRGVDGEGAGLDESTKLLLQEMASDFDVLQHLSEERGIDFVALRVASLDLLTHGHFKELQRSGQDDGDMVLYRAYRYIDRRLAGLVSDLRPNDVLIVMSDHGIRTPLEHDHRAVFLAIGAGIEPGRLPGSPPIQDVSGWVANLLGVDENWPGAGSQAWIPPSTVDDAALAAYDEAAPAAGAAATADLR